MKTSPNLYLLTSYIIGVIIIFLTLLIGTTTSSYDVTARFQKSSTVSGIVTTVAGYKRLYDGSVEDGVAATSRRILSPEGLPLDIDGNLYIAATGDNKILKVTTSTGIITTAAGTGVGGYGGDGGKATSAMLDGPAGVTLDTTDRRCRKSSDTEDHNEYWCDYNSG